MLRNSEGSQRLPCLRRLLPSVKLCNSDFHRLRTDPSFVAARQSKQLIAAPFPLCVNSSVVSQPLQASELVSRERREITSLLRLDSMTTMLEPTDHRTDRVRSLRSTHKRRSKEKSKSDHCVRKIVVETSSRKIGKPLGGPC